MYSFTKHLTPPSLLIQCECGRDYMQEEMYCCLNCATSVCRYCTSNEIYCYYCRGCNETILQSDMQTLNTTCTSCFECPRCRNVLRRNTDNEKIFSIQCSYCYWSSKSIRVADVNVQVAYGRINSLQKLETEQALKDFQIQYQRLKELDNALQLQKKQLKKKSFLRSVSQSFKTEPIRRMTLEEIQQNQLEKDKQILINRYNLNISTKSILLSDYQNEPIKQSVLPVPLGLLAKRNRKCRKCQKMIIQLNIEKSDKHKRCTQSIYLYHYEYAPHISILKMKYANKEKTELIVQLLMQNTTKNQFEFQLHPLNQQLIDTLKLLKVSNLPSQQFQFKDAMDNDNGQQQQIFEALVQLKDATKVQFAFQVQVVIKLPIESMKLNYNAVVYVGRVA